MVFKLGKKAQGGLGGMQILLILVAIVAIGYLFKSPAAASAPGGAAPSISGTGSLSGGLPLCNSEEDVKNADGTSRCFCDPTIKTTVTFNDVDAGTLNQDPNQKFYVWFNGEEVGKVYADDATASASPGDTLKYISGYTEQNASNYTSQLVETQVKCKTTQTAEGKIWSNGNTTSIITLNWRTVDDVLVSNGASNQSIGANEQLTPVLQFRGTSRQCFGLPKDAGYQNSGLRLILRANSTEFTSLDVPDSGDFEEKWTKSSLPSMITTSNGFFFEVFENKQAICDTNVRKLGVRLKSGTTNPAAEDVVSTQVSGSINATLVDYSAYIDQDNIIVVDVESESNVEIGANAKPSADLIYS